MRHGMDYIAGLASNAVLDALAAETALYRHAMSSDPLATAEFDNV
jgi:hypothetical protein